MITTWPVLTVCMSGYRTGSFWEHSRRVSNHSDTYYSYFGVFESYLIIFWREFPRNDQYTARVDCLPVGLSNGAVLKAFPRTFESFWDILQLFWCIWVIFNYFWREFPRDNYYTARVNSLHVGLSNGAVLEAFPRTFKSFWDILQLFWCIWVIFNYFLTGISAE